MLVFSHIFSALCQSCRRNCDILSEENFDEKPQKDLFAGLGLRLQTRLQTTTVSLWPEFSAAAPAGPGGTLHTPSLPTASNPPASKLLQNIPPYSS